jgi:hypothetical protein
MTMNYRLAAAAAVAFLIGSAPAFAAIAPTSPSAMAPESTIMAGPDKDTDSTTDATNLHVYLREVCPTVLSNTSAYSPTLVRFCNEMHG